MQASKESRRPERGREGQAAERSVPAATLDLRDEDEVSDPVAEGQYLRAHGWKKVAIGECPNPKKRWLDPMSGKPSRKILVVPERRDLAGRIEKDAVYQTLAGVPVWYYSRQEAVQMQRDREAEAKNQKGTR